MTPLPARNDDDAALQGAVFDAVAESVATARTYTNVALDFAAIRDTRGLAYATRCAAAAIATAAEMVAEMRPSNQGRAQP